MKNFSAQLQQPLTHNDKWRNFGEAVEIQENVLDDIAAKDHRVSRMLEYWLRCETEEPTWNDVAEVLKKIECEQAARDIERIFIANGKCIALIRALWSTYIPHMHTHQTLCYNIHSHAYI